MESTDLLKKTINFWVEYHFKAFTDCAADRERLNGTENENGLKVSSILGEVEVLTGSIMGIARSCLSKRKLRDPNELLEKNTIYYQENLIDWVVNQGNDFPEFLKYMMVIENLRVSTIEYLKASTRTKVV